MRDRSIVALMLRNPVAANILMFLVIFGGVAGVWRMSREIFPSFSLDQITVTVPYPGADPEEVEEGICRALENALEGLPDAKSVRTYARENVGSAVIECAAYADVGKVKEDVNDRVDGIRTFPEDAEAPTVREVSLEHEVLNIAVWGDVPERQLRETAVTLQDELRLLPGVSRVDVGRVRDYEVSIEVSESRLRRYGLTFSDIGAAISGGSLNLPGGTLRTPAEDLRIRVLGRRYYGRDFGSLVIRALPDGRLLRLRDLARVRDAFTEDVESYARFNGKPAASIYVRKNEAEDAIRISRDIRAYLDKHRASLPAAVHVTVWGDVSRMIRGRIDLLCRNGAIGLVLVFTMLWLFLDLRLSFWVTMGIPISISGALAIMALTGQSINMISLFALIMVLGIIVDDAIIVGESIYVHRDVSATPFAAAVAGVREVWWPVITAVLTTVAAFVPLFFVKGVIGRFIRVMPGPVIAALGISLVEALIILPVHLRHLSKRRPNATTPAARFRRVFSHGLERFVIRIYGPAMRHVLRWRYVTIAGAAAVFIAVVGMIQGGLIGFSFFPNAESDFIHAVVELPGGTPVATTARVTEQLLQAWWRVQDAYAGGHQGERLGVAVYAVTGGTLGPVPETGNHQTEVFVELLPAEKRSMRHEDILASWRRYTGRVPGAVEVRFESQAGGPKGADVEIALRGRDHAKLEQAIAAVRSWLERFDGIYGVRSTYKFGKREIRVALRPAARPLGLTLAALAQQLRQGFYGQELMRVQRGRDEVRVMLRYPRDERRSLADLRRIRIRSTTGAEIPLGQVAKLSFGRGLTRIERAAGMRVATIRADATAAADTRAITRAFNADLLPRLKRMYGVDAFRGQESQDRVDALTSLALGAAIAMLVIYLIIASVFKSYLQPLVIMMTIPLGLIGAALGHYLYALPLSMMSLFGMVALTGIVVNDAIVMIVAVNTALADGTPLFEALCVGGQRRFRAILLTTLTTFAGLFPMIMEKSFQAQFLVPMAISIAFGVAVATITTLVVLPCLLAAINDARRLSVVAWQLRWPGREEVEPAVHAKRQIERGGGDG